MASEDVIELGSSDEEAEPASKKVKLNAMVHIPHRLSGVTIEPSKPNLPLLHKKLSGAPITIKKVSNINLSPLDDKRNRKPAFKQRPVVKQNIKPLKKPIPIKQGLNPLNVKMTNSQIAINKVPAVPMKEPIKISKLEGTSFSSLPSSITITKCIPTQKYPNVNIQNKINKNIKILPKVRKVPKVNVVHNPVASKSSVGDVLTVELDDDEQPSNHECTNGPQWYLRPEEQNQSEKIEMKNNTEPQSSKFIEITIEDSPVKAVNNTHQIGAEFAITIEDSPIKLTAHKKKSTNGSDEENKGAHKKPKTRKQLEYPKTVSNVNSTKNSVEIELEPLEVAMETVEANKNNAVQKDIMDNNLQLNSSQINSVPKNSAKTIDSKELEIPCLKTDNQTNRDTEFHPVYQNFIDLCFKLENSDDMKKIVEKKIKGYYRQVPKEYTESEEFIDMVSTKITSMKAGPERMYLYIKDVVDELNFKRKTFKPKVVTNQETNDKEAEKFFYGEESEFDSKRQRQIRKLEKTLKKLHRAIQKLEEQEVDFDDEEDSVYLLTERYKERMIRVHAKFCQLTNTKMPSEPRIHIEARPGQPSGPAKRLEKMINKKVPIGTPLPFPDFHDVLKCVREANEEDKLRWNEADIMDEARDLFMRCGRKLQRRRQENEWRLAASRISVELDPAADNDELKKKLDQNKILAVKKETEVFNKYADKQNLMKLEAVEIEDKEAEESPAGSDDDDVHEDDVSLENKEKRKERLRRLLQEKFTKDNEKDENKQIRSPKEETQLDNGIQNENCSNIKIKSVESLSETVTIDDKVQTLSDDSTKVNSDMDELHLLQKLYSESEANDSSVNSSDSGSFIAISDSLDSSSDNKKQPNEDVISIENSSYSEPEGSDVENVVKTNPAKCPVLETIEETFPSDTKCTTLAEKKIDKTNNDEYSESIENILLASSDEECGASKKKNDNKDVCVDVNNDILSMAQDVQELNSIQVGIDISETKENSLVMKKQSNNTSTKENIDQAVASNSLKEVEISHEKIKSNAPVLIGNNINNCEETNITSTLDNNIVTADLTTSGSVKKIQDNNKLNTEYDSVEQIVGSSTEAMEVVTTTSTSEI
ncbi:daxx-like protein [Manduca sexta]|uniref:daxx-like protein n=1 Tax=Manduca sexta TaxID=7130 RepID=UPI00188F9832|nr:daxx-like protein [Manduca sexta]XP_030035595.2 daxx-like protein [Manduca sexta]